MILLLEYYLSFLMRYICNTILILSSFLHPMHIMLKHRTVISDERLPFIASLPAARDRANMKLSDCRFFNPPHFSSGIWYDGVENRIHRLPRRRWTGRKAWRPTAEDPGHNLHMRMPGEERLCIFKSKACDSSDWIVCYTYPNILVSYQHTRRCQIK